MKHGREEEGGKTRAGSGGVKQGLGERSETRTDRGG